MSNQAPSLALEQGFDGAPAPSGLVMRGVVPHISEPYPLMAQQLRGVTPWTWTRKMERAPGPGYCTKVTEKPIEILDVLENMEERDGVNWICPSLSE
jgi:hypothetical protein